MRSIEYREVNNDRVKHIAIIPDGNRRWAKSRGIPSFMGHYEGLKTLEKVLKAAIAEESLTHITIWGASVDNILKRPDEEVSHLYKVFLKAATLSLKKASEMPEGTRLFIRGDWEEYFSDELKTMMRRINSESRKRDGRLTVTALLAYSGKGDMLRAVGKIKDDNLAASEEELLRNLSTGDLPPVDLVIRTGGEPHNSDGFMMWQTANAALYFTETLWPDFTAEEFKKAVSQIEDRERRLGR